MASAPLENARGQHARSKMQVRDQAAAALQALGGLVQAMLEATIADSLVD